MSERPNTRLYAWLLRHPLACFLLLVLGFIVFGGVTLDLAKVLLANLGFLGRHGLDAVLDSGLWQLAGLLLQAALGLGGYLLFKLCEHALVHRLAHGVH